MKSPIEGSSRFGCGASAHDLAAGARIRRHEVNGLELSFTAGLRDIGAVRLYNGVFRQSNRSTQ